MPSTMKGTNLCIDQYLYEKQYQYSNGRTYWVCIQNAKKNLNQESSPSCNARAVTTIDPSSNELVVQIGPAESKHNHSPTSSDDEGIQIVAEPNMSLESQGLSNGDIQTSRYCVGEGYCIAEINKRIKMTISINDPTTDRKICLRISDTPIAEEEKKKRAPGVIILGATNCNLYAYATVSDEVDTVTKVVNSIKKEMEIPVIDLDSSDDEQYTNTDNIPSEPMVENTNNSIKSAGDLIEKLVESTGETIQPQEENNCNGGETTTRGGINNVPSSQSSDTILKNCPNFQPLATVTDRGSGMMKAVDLVDLNDTVVTMHQLITLQNGETSNPSDISLEQCPIIINLVDDQSETSRDFQNSQFGTLPIVQTTNSAIVDAERNIIILHQEPDTPVAATGEYLPVEHSNSHPNDDGQNNVGEIHVPVQKYPTQIVLPKVNNSISIPKSLFMPNPPSKSQ